MLIHKLLTDAQIAALQQSMREINQRRVDEAIRERNDASTLYASDAAFVDAAIKRSAEGKG